MVNINHITLNGAIPVHEDGCTFPIFSARPQLNSPSYAYPITLLFVRHSLLHTQLVYMSCFFFLFIYLYLWYFLFYLNPS